MYYIRMGTVNTFVLLLILGKMLLLFPFLYTFGCTFVRLCVCMCMCVYVCMYYITISCEEFFPEPQRTLLTHWGHTPPLIPTLPPLQPCKSTPFLYRGKVQMTCSEQMTNNIWVPHRELSLIFCPSESTYFIEQNICWIIYIRKSCWLIGFVMK